MSGQIWVTGDIHGTAGVNSGVLGVNRFSSSNFEDGKNLDKEDVVEILGDFGFVWNWKGEDKEEKYWLDWLNDKPWTTVVTLGNHENYDRIEKLPVEIRFGAPVYVLRPSIFILQSGYIYNINGKKIWNFNGARSHDIKSGILDSEDPDYKKKGWELDRQGKFDWRVKNINWWEQEVEQNPEVYQKGIESLEKEDWFIDYIFTHCTSKYAAASMGFYENDRLTDYLEDIHRSVHFKGWYFGHYHMNKTFFPGQICLYDKIERIA